MVYIHIPYCRSFCTYCGFYSIIPSCGYGALTDALCAEIEAREGEIRSAVFLPSGSRKCKGAVNTIYIGGGTPSVLPVDQIARLASACFRAVYGTESGLSMGGAFDEFTVEVNPDDIVRGGVRYAESLLGTGVTRVSMGVQSMDDRVLKWMNRRHNAAAARKAYRILREAGADNISIDLIFGYDIGRIIPSAGLSDTDSDRYWMCMLEAALDIGGNGSLPEHISAYQLSVEEGSALAWMIEAGRYAEAQEDLCAAQYSRLCSVLAAAGYHHYEISNFARSGFEALHNSAYWRHTPYVGIGPAAHSLSRRPENIQPAGSVAGQDMGSKEMTDWVRSWNAEDVDAYIAASLSGDWGSVRGAETLTREQFREEDIMLGLRTDRGVPSSLIMTSGASAQKVESLLASGALVRTGGDQTGRTDPEKEPYLRIPEDRFFVSDDIIAELI